MNEELCMSSFISIIHHLCIQNDCKKYCFRENRYEYCTITVNSLWECSGNVFYPCVIPNWTVDECQLDQSHSGGFFHPKS